MKPTLVSTIGPTSLIQCLWESLCFSTLKDIKNQSDNLLSEPEVFDVVLDHFLLILISSILDSFLKRSNHISHEDREVFRAHGDLDPFIIVSAEVLKNFIVLLRTADFKLKITLCIFVKTGVQGRNVLLLAELIDQFRVSLRNVRSVVA